MIRKKLLFIILCTGFVSPHSITHAMQNNIPIPESPQEKRTLLTTCALVTLVATSLGAAAIDSCYAHTVGECSSTNKFAIGGCFFVATSSASLFIKTVLPKVQRAVDALQNARLLPPV